MNYPISDVKAPFFIAGFIDPYYEDIDTTIKDILANKIRKEHLINYLKHSYKIPGCAKVKPIKRSALFVQQKRYLH
jgi:hypothetical protein